MKKVFYLVFILTLAAQVYPQWVQTNGPCGANIRCLAVRDDSSGSRNIFAGTEGGIYISTDDGSSWKRTGFEPPESYYLYTIAVNDTFVLASTNSGIYRSRDNGSSWSKAEPGLPDGAQVFAVSGKNLYAISNSHFYIYADNGITWRKASSGLPEGDFGELSTLATLGNIVFAGTWNSGIYRSTDNGISWSTVNSGLPEMTKVYAFAEKETDLFAGTMQGIFRSTDNGTSWIRADSGIPRDENGWSFIHAMTVSGKNIYAGVSHTYYTRNRAIYISTDNGASWKDVSPHLPWNPFYLSMAACGKYIFAITGMGLYRTDDDGVNWTESSAGFLNTNINTFIINGTKLYTASQLGIHLSTDYGESWSKIGSFGSGPWDCLINTLAAYGNKLFAGGLFSNYYYSTAIVSLNNGKEWVKADSGIPADVPIYDLEVMGNVLFAAGLSSIYFSKDSGRVWTEASHGLFGVNDLVICGTDLFAATELGIYVSNDSAKNWTLLYNPGAVKFLHTCGRHLLAGSGFYIYHSEDYGKSWVRANTRYSPMEYFTVVQANGKNIIVATHKGRVFLTDNYCKSWTEATTGLPAVDFPDWIINRLSFSAGYLFAGTTRGVWKRPFSEIGTDVKNPPEVPGKFSLEQNYPNPFNPTTTIKFSLPYSSHVTLRIYDLLGSEVARLIDEEMPAGIHNSVWTADNVSSGVYFYELRAGSFVEKKKMILLR